jgi:molecular chaperone GrpE
MADEKPEQKQEAQEGEPKKDEDDSSALKERMLRLAAEFDNYKKRVKADIEKAQITGKAEMLKNLLPVLDEFEIAMISVGSVQDKSLAKGIEMVYANLQDALEREGLTELDTNGMYDPYKHEIVVSRADSKKRPGTILEVVKKGYTFNGIMLRPASVIISKEEDKK